MEAASKQISGKHWEKPPNDKTDATVTWEAPGDGEFSVSGER